MIQYFVQIFYCQLVAFEIMGNHYHFIVFMEAFRELSRTELIEKAKQLYGKRFEINTCCWDDSDWEWLNRKLFDVSCLMQHINGRFGAWFNRRNNRRGPLWYDRFKNPELLDLEAVQECLLYIELNALRAGLVKRPEQWKAGSARLRWKQKDHNLMPLSRIFVGVDPKEVYSFYRSRLYCRGAVPTKGNQAQISPEILEREARSGFERTGLYQDRLRFFTDGLAVGCKEKVGELLEVFRSRKDYQRRRNPVSHLEGLIFTLREQRSNAK
jgi:REP element-mobilizing transposase RayT